MIDIVLCALTARHGNNAIPFCTAPASGDVVTIGTYGSNNREYVSRVVESYNAGTVAGIMKAA